MVRDAAITVNASARLPTAAPARVPDGRRPFAPSPSLKLGRRISGGNSGNAAVWRRRFASRKGVAMAEYAALSLVVATKGRAAPFAALFASLEAQDFRDFEVIVVDQNGDGRAGDPAGEGWSFPVLHLRTPGEGGASRARNAGFAHARGAVVLFPDDDCWYPPHMLGEALHRMRDHGADVLAGRAADSEGRDINGRFERAVMHIGRDTVWTTGIEWMVFFRREVLAMTGGYDVDVGIGAATPWQSCEAQELMLRALRAGYRCVFDPAIHGHHAELDIRSPAMVGKGRGYARGFGYVLRRHGFSPVEAARWIARPILRAAQSAARGDRAGLRYFAAVALGRYEGWRMRPLPARSRAEPAVELSPAGG